MLRTVKEESDTDDDDYFIHSFSTRCKEDHWLETIKVTETQFIIKLNIGADCRVFSKNLLDKANGWMVETRTKHIVGYTNNKMRIIREVKLLC